LNRGVSALALATLLAGGLALPTSVSAQTVADRALSDLKAEAVGACTTVTINLNIRVQLVSWFPETSGRELHVRLLPLDGGNVTQVRDSLRTPATVPALRSVQYEGDNPAGPILSLFFTHDMAFAVEAGTTPQQLVIRLSEPKVSCAATGSMAPAGNAAQAAAAPAIAPQLAIPPGLYVINVASVPGQVGELSPAQRQALAGLTVYETQFEKDAQAWRRLRAGFFETREAAEAARRKLAALWPEAWIVKVSADERAQGAMASSGAATAPLATAPRPAAGAAAGSEADAVETARLIADAEQAIRDAGLDRAIQLLTTAAARAENANTPRAIELLGLTRERKGQAAHAQAEYEEYLRRYPSSEGAERVRERLAALNAGSTPGAPQQLRAATGSAGTAKAWTFGVRGSFSQFYFRDQGRTSTFTTSSTRGTEVDNSVNVNQLLTAADITVSAGNDRRQFQLRAAGSYTKNFGTSASVSTVNNGNQTLTYRSRPGGGIEALTALYLDYSDSDLNSSLRIGRQTRNSAGVLGRFDGGLLGFQANRHLRVNAVAGYPVLSSHQMSVLKERPFYGLSVDLGAKRSPLQLSAYWFDQRARGGFIDRRSIGMEARLLKTRFNAYAMIDYDVKFRQLNLGLVSFNYNFPDSASLSLTADYRKSPLLTTTNALIGQIDVASNAAIPTLGGLRPFFTDPQIYQLALDRTLTAKSVTVTYSRPLTTKLQISTDFNMTDTGGTPATPATAGTLAVGALPATGKEYYYGAQLIGSGLLWANDIYILAGRYSNTSNARVWTADFNARVPVTSKFRLSPRLRYGFRDNKPTAATPVPGTFRQFQPTLRMNYYPIRHSEIEIELGGNFSSQSQYNGTSWDRIKEKGWVLSAGYRLDF
jgi:hypothetical protein